MASTAAKLRIPAPERLKPFFLTKLCHFLSPPSLPLWGWGAKWQSFVRKLASLTLFGHFRSISIRLSKGSNVSQQHGMSQVERTSEHSSHDLGAMHTSPMDNGCGQDSSFKRSLPISKICRISRLHWPKLTVHPACFGIPDGKCGWKHRHCCEGRARVTRRSAADTNQKLGWIQVNYLAIFRK